MNLMHQSGIFALLFYIGSYISYYFMFRQLVKYSYEQILFEPDLIPEKIDLI